MNKVFKLEPMPAPRKQAMGAAARATAVPVRAVVQQARPGEPLTVLHTTSGMQWKCEVLETVCQAVSPGDRVLVLPPEEGAPAIVLGRIVGYPGTTPAAKLTFEAQESLTLKCGESSIDLRADGKVMIRGEDVLVRAKGTKRIRAGTVSIN